LYFLSLASILLIQNVYGVQRAYLGHGYSWGLDSDVSADNNHTHQALTGIEKFSPKILDSF
jgi:hypothetical protein